MQRNGVIRSHLDSFSLSDVKDNVGSMIEISFCIPTLNRANLLQASLRSIISQADQRVEIVIVDGGSTDETLAVIETFKASFPQICVYESEAKSGVDRDI